MKKVSEFKCKCDIYARQRCNLGTVIFLTVTYLCILIYFVAKALAFSIKT